MMFKKKGKSIIKKLVLFVILFLLSLSTAYAKTIEYNLEIAFQEVNITGKPTTAMTINGSIPGPVLRFHEGDIARIHVHNKMDIITTSTNYLTLLLTLELSSIRIPGIFGQMLKF